jgi:formate dehydrogenase subunit delta
MHDADLIRMANQIADFFEPYPREEALAGISGHIDQFWEPRMQTHLFALLDKGGQGLSPLALEAALMLQRKDMAAGAAALAKN